MATANVSFVRREIAKLMLQYKLIRDVLSGEPTIKEARITYLPMPNASDKSEENKARYNAYLMRAVFYNVARRTLYGLLGQVFMREPEIKVPSDLEAVVADATGEGVSLVQLAKKATGLTLAYSRCGLFVDYPETDSVGGVTLEELEQGNIRPTFYIYQPTEVINWRTIDRGAEVVLSLVVILESFCSADDGFEMKTAAQFRVLKLDAAGNYVHEIWRDPLNVNYEDGSKIPRGNFALHKTFLPKDKDGNPLKEIPFTFIGSENNDSNVDNPNFYDLASLNIAHYRNSADYEESCYIVGQPTVVATGLTEEWVTNVLKGKITFGSNGGIPLPAGATCELLQAEANTMLKEAMDTKERQMVALGAKLVEDKEVQRTATEAKIEATGEGSILSSTAKNVSAAFAWALKYATKFTGGVDTGIIFELNTDFDIMKMSAEEIKNAVEQWQKNAITFEEMRAVLRNAGTATEEDGAAKSKIAADMVEAMALMPPENVPGTKKPPQQKPAEKPKP